MNYKNLTPQENEYFAENELIQIIPNFKEDQFQFISGTFGPFRPAKPVTVPLWLAIYLKSRNKCSIQLPKWLDYSCLLTIKSIEKEIVAEFSPDLPYYYYEIATLLFNNCSDEFSGVGQQSSNLQKLKSVIEDIYEVRKEKLLKSIRSVKAEDTPIMNLSSIGAVELNQVRPAFSSAYSILYQMQNLMEQNADETQVV
ncbi:dna replication complex gins protein psf2 [Stylonychia lemnae]|uniref:DNA replication complex GINS protein PSF2 n=1 Tax=Stylonychia lemnae TaxID=5949 RepID=A0A078A8V5_STYLE|nr:dna replication complex gins protein psf2 [Stylonychia lemnae]|eukprot:CDW78705.1 dna replication complex gins protein psf2 [Stylonychia lemnae]